MGVGFKNELVSITLGIIKGWDKMSKIKKIIQEEDGKKIFQSYMFFCPGCKCGHPFNMVGGITWTFNNDLDKPTLHPSYLTGHKNFTKNRCHSFIKDGKIQFLSDCYHELKSQTVELPEFPDTYGT